MSTVMEFQTRINHLQHQIDCRDERILEVEKTLLAAKIYVSIKEKELKEKDERIKELEANMQEMCFKGCELESKLSIAVEALKEVRQPQNFSSRSDVAEEALKEIGEMK